MSPQLRAASGSPIRLGGEIGVGGEGAVYEVAGTSGVVAKVYHAAVEREKVRKLHAMVAHQPATLTGVSAWPKDVLLDTAGAVRGVLMPRIVGAREAHSVYNPRQRLRVLPNANWKYLVMAARNAAAAVGAVHDAGHVIGDVNQKGFLVAEDATVRLIDCDSFQIISGTDRFPCLVGVPEFTPPELFGQDFTKALRTPNHDAFGLAVLVFHFLFMGRHPFAGRFSGTTEMPVEKAVKELRFAYSQHAAALQMTAPPGTLPLSAASFEVASLFERAFSRQASQGGRPTAPEWTFALDALAGGLAVCKLDRSHTYFSKLGRCPWCDLERAGGVAFFVPAIASAAHSLDVAAIARLLKALALPPAPAVPVVATPAVTNAAPLPRAAVVREFLGEGGIGVGIIVAVLSLLGFAPMVGAIALIGLGWALRSSSGVRQERARRKTELDAASNEWRRAVESWRREYETAANQFHVLHSRTGEMLAELQQLPEKQQRAQQDLHSKREQMQRHVFLDGFEIESARIRGIGVGLAAMLKAYGYETAADVDRAVQRVPGIGPAKESALHAWRGLCEARFRFDPARGVDPAAVAAVKAKFAQRRAEIEKNLLDAQQQLPVLHERTVRWLRPNLPQFSSVVRRVTMAKAAVAAAT